MFYNTYLTITTLQYITISVTNKKFNWCFDYNESISFFIHFSTFQKLLYYHKIFIWQLDIGQQQHKQYSLLNWIMFIITFWLHFLLLSCGVLPLAIICSW